MNRLLLLDSLLAWGTRSRASSNGLGQVQARVESPDAAVGGARKIGNSSEARRDALGRQRLRAEPAEHRDVDARVVTGYDGRVHVFFTGDAARRSVHERTFNGVVGFEHMLDLDRIDVSPTTDDQLA